MWQPQSDGWGSWPIQQSAYANVPADQVDWGALAQQWIAHKEQTVHVAAGHGTSDINVHGHGSSFSSWGWSAQEPGGAADWSSSGASSSTWQPAGNMPPQETPVPSVLPQFVDYGHGNYEVQGFDYNHGGASSQATSHSSWDYQSTNAGLGSHSAWPPEPLQQPPPPPPPPDEIIEDRSHGLPNTPSSSVSISDVVTSQRSHHHQQHHKKQSAHHMAPAIPVAVFDHDDVNILDAAKRKTLPSWIRDGLEKMEREKLKKLEREKQEKEKEEKERLRAAAEKAALDMLGSQHSGEPTLPRKSRFDSDDEDVSGDAPKEGKVPVPAKGSSDVATVDGGLGTALSVSAAAKLPASNSVTVTALEVSSDVKEQPYVTTDSDEDEKEMEQQITAEEKQRQFIEKVKQMLTTVLRDVTDEQIRVVAKETYAKCRQHASKAPAKQLAKSSALASLTAFGYGDDSADSGSDSDQGRKRKSASSSSDSDEEKTERRLRKKKADFHKVQRDRLLRLDREEQQARELGAGTTGKEKSSSEKKRDSAHGIDNSRTSGEKRRVSQTDVAQPRALVQPDSSPSSATGGSTDERKISHDKHQSHSSADSGQKQMPGDERKADAAGDRKHNVDNDKRPAEEQGAQAKQRESKDDVSGNQVPAANQDDEPSQRHPGDLVGKVATSACSIKTDSMESGHAAASLKAKSQSRKSRSPESRRHGSPLSAVEALPVMSKDNANNRSSSDATHSSSKIGHNAIVAESENGGVHAVQGASSKSETSRSSQKKTSRSAPHKGSSDSSSTTSSDSDSDSKSSSDSDNKEKDVVYASKRASSRKGVSKDRSGHRYRESSSYRSNSVASVHSSKEHNSRNREGARPRSDQRHSRHSSPRNPSRSHSSRHKDDKRDRRRRSSSRSYGHSVRSRSPAADRKSSSGRTRHRDRSTDRPSKRRHRETSSSDSEERGGKKASRKTSRRRRSRS